MINLLNISILGLLLISIILVIVEQVLRIKSNKNYIKELAKMGNILTLKNKPINTKQLINILDGKEETINLIFMKLVASSVEAYKVEEMESINRDNYEIIFHITVNT